MPTPEPSPPTPDDDLDIGQTLRGLRAGMKVFGRYRLKGELGRGGMGVVWSAEDERLDLAVALKFLPEALAHDETAVDDLRRETQQCMKLGHTHIVKVYDLVEEGGAAAIVMEQVKGKTLAKLRLEKAGRVFEVGEVREWVRQVVEALGYAHEEGRMVHRDLKPSNVMVTERGQVKVMDFGIASSLSDSASRVSKAVAGGQGTGGGTLPYMSPQQLLGYPASVGDDVYGLGATVYELLTGKPPFYSGSIERQIESVVPVRMSQRRAELKVEGSGVIPEAWERVVAACLEKESGKRPRSVKEVWEGLSGEKTMKVGKTVSGDSGVGAGAGMRGKKAVLAVAGVVVLAGLSWWGLAGSKVSGVAEPVAKAVVPKVLAEGQVKVSANLAGAEVWAGGEKLGETGPGGWLVTLKEGEHELEVRRAPWEALKQGVRVGADGVAQPGSWVANFKPGTVQVSSRVAGAEVYAGGARVGRAPQAVELEPGRHEVEVRYGEWPAESWVVVVNGKGEAAPGVVEAVFLGGTLEVGSEPEGALVTVERAGAEPLKGVTPLRVELRPGEVQVGLSLAGYETAALRGKVQAGEVLRLSEALKQEGSALDQGAVGQTVEATLPGGVVMKFGYCPAGSFRMGSPAGEADRSENENQEQVKISEGFWLGQHEVTQGQWEAVMGSNPSNFKGDDLPVETVSWEEAQVFITKLNQSVALPAGWKYALPSEAQWEYACRAGTETPFHFGSVLNGREANCDGNFPYGTTTKGPFLEKTAFVGSYQPNKWGLYDMHGNVWEWCADWYGEKLVGGTDPVGASTGSIRVLRGGSWIGHAQICRAALRSGVTPGYRGNGLGFRVAAVPAGAR
jgi:formylglycine-generating enzyme required for sulfatase activity